MPKLANDLEVLPDALTARDQWICWRGEERDGRETKVPIEPSTGEYASTTDPGTWTSVEAALVSVEPAKANGIGFVFTEDDPIVGIDLDDCRDPKSGTLEEWARDIIVRLDSYAEVSPSGTGVHVIAEGELPDGRSRSGDVEMYETSRFFTVTGAHLDQTPTKVEQRPDAIRGVHADYVQDSADDGDKDQDNLSVEDTDGVDLEDNVLLERARAAENGARFDALWRGQTSGYDSHSEADMALCLHLAFWTGGDSARMDDLFRQSGLMREKWDDVHYADGSTYGERTIERALGMVDEVYEPEQDSEDGGAGPTSATTAESGSREDKPQAASPQRDDSVYLEERNRLLLEKVRSQQDTIDRQASRLARLERDLDQLREQLAAREEFDEIRADRPSTVDRIKAWLHLH